eukprot:scpid72866/ scgid14725/ Rho GTPase-activating protein 24; Filamin-A-associated RhoGAP; RAC1- and CDC42-specific GTPase-activating protein of 72 kDa; Rho-type GTPase-activating protein 24; RhoGAP of 73 kDa; Sarcoma antigen NY-SAR-88; p73RhoGAP
MNAGGMMVTRAPRGHAAMGSSSVGSHKRPTLFTAKPANPAVRDPTRRPKPGSSAVTKAMEIPPFQKKPVTESKPTSDDPPPPARPPKSSDAVPPARLPKSSDTVPESETPAKLSPPLNRRKRPSLTGTVAPTVDELQAVQDDRRPSTGKTPPPTITEPTFGRRGSSDAEKLTITLVNVDDAAAQQLSPTSPVRRKLSVGPDLDDINEEGASKFASSKLMPQPASPGVFSEEPKKMKKSFSMRGVFSRKSAHKNGDGNEVESQKAQTFQGRSLYGGRKGGMKNCMSAPVMTGESATMPASVFKTGGAPGERSDEVRALHHLTTQCCAYLVRGTSVNEEGLFRVPADLNKIKQMRQQVLHTGRCELSNVHDPHLVAGLLKLHFRELKFNVVPQGDPAKDLLEAAKTRNVFMAKRCLAKLPITHNQVLKELVNMLETVSEHKAVNFMSPTTIGKSCGPSIFHGYNPQDSAYVLTFLIENNSQVLNTR